MAAPWKFPSRITSVPPKDLRIELECAVHVLNGDPEVLHAA